MRRGIKLNRLLDFWVGIPALNLLSVFFRHTSRPTAKPRKVAAMCSPALGDTLLFSSALQDLRKAYPAAEISHVCMSPNRAAASIIPGADRRIVIDLTRPDRAVRALREERFDIFFDYTSWQRLTAFITLLSGSRHTVGFRTPGMYRGRAYDSSVVHRADLHEVDNFRQLTRVLGLTAKSAPAVCLPPDSDLENVWPHGFERPVVVLHLWPSGQNAFLREWPEERWAELALGIAARIPGCRFAISGTAGELPRTEAFVERLRALGLEADALLASFRDLALFLSKASVVVSVNTGVMHLSAILGACTVSINGPNSNGRWGPVGPNAFGVESSGPDCGFLHLGFDFDGKPTDCMERITVREVLNAISLVREGASADRAYAEVSAAQEPGETVHLRRTRRSA